MLSCTFCSNIECILVEIRIYKKKWLIYGTYNLNRSVISSHLFTLSKSIDKFSPSYDNILILGDFNSDPTDENMIEFFNLYYLQNLIKVPTCFKNPHNPSCIDLVITNRTKSFQNSKAIETGLSDFHKLTLSVMKIKYKKQPPTIISYRDYRLFSNSLFRTELDGILSFDLNFISNDTFVHIIMELLNKHAPIKFKYIRANDSPFMTKELRKAIMLRSKLRNRLNKRKTSEANHAYKRQRNICTSLLRKTKKTFFETLNPSVISDNKSFWKIIKPFFSEKVSTTSKITLCENDGMHDNDAQVADDFGNFFSNIVSELNIVCNDIIFPEICIETDPIVKAIKKNKNYPRILKIKEMVNEHDSFSFSPVTKDNIIKEIYNLNDSKASPITSIPTKIIKENCDIFSTKIHMDFNASTVLGIFPSNLKYADVSLKPETD